MITESLRQWGICYTSHSAEIRHYGTEFIQYVPRKVTMWNGESEAQIFHNKSSRSYSSPGRQRDENSHKCYTAFTQLISGAAAGNEEQGWSVIQNKLTHFSSFGWLRLDSGAVWNSIPATFVEDCFLTPDDLLLCDGSNSNDAPTTTRNIRDDFSSAKY